MMRSFSERKGLKEPLTVIQKHGMSEELRNSLWNVLDLLMWRGERFLWVQLGEAEIWDFSKILWFQYFKQPIDSRPDRPGKVLAVIREYFFSCEWNEVYDFLEWLQSWAAKGSNLHKYRHLPTALNGVLERELAGYRFVNGVCTEITDEQEIRVLEEELSDDRFSGVQVHLRTALRLLSDRESPDYRNSIKESISAVESLAKVVTDNRKASLSDALAELEKSGHLHKALKQAFVKFYAWTSDEGGIRHAMLDEPNLTAADAKYVLLACTSFINYLKSKL